MNKRVRTRSIIIVVVTLFSIYLFAGAPPSLQGMRERIRLGLDLQGGTQLIMQVNTDDALKATTDQTIESLQAQMQKDVITVRQVTRTDRVDQFTITGVDPTKDGEFKNLVTGLYPDWELAAVSGGVPNTYTAQLKPQAVQAYREQSVDQALTTIAKRIDTIGVTEPVIQKRGGAGVYELLLQFPGIDDPNKLKELIGRPAVLQLKLVQGAGEYPTKEAALAQSGGVLPADLEILEGVDRAPDGSRIYFVVNKVARVSGSELKNSSVTRDEYGKPAVSFSLNAEGAARFGRLTGENIGKRLAIVLDNLVVSAPTIQGRITDSGVINGGAGGFAPEEAKDLSIVLNSGALPASLTYLEQRVVSASLGADSIRKGLYASVAALIGVVIFMLFYYRWAGVNAAISMALNLVILMGAMAYFDATLTLPGLAGIILTIGVGIDSNVLIFERIREEFKAGKTAMAAVNNGFGRVFTTIVDTHLAALISAMFLFLFGTGPVKGFAVTLVIGLVANVFTAVFVSRTLFDWLLGRKPAGATELSI